MLPASRLPIAGAYWCRPSGGHVASLTTTNSWCLPMPAIWQPCCQPHDYQYLLPTDAGRLAAMLPAGRLPHDYSSNSCWPLDCWTDVLRQKYMLPLFWWKYDRLGGGVGWGLEVGGGGKGAVCLFVYTARHSFMGGKNYTQKIYEFSPTTHTQYTRL